MPDGGALVAPAAEAASRLRGARIFHPVGEAFAAAVVITDTDRRLGSLRGEWAATVRLSRGIGLPWWAPDFLGLAMRLHDVPGGDQDVLLVSSGRAFPFRHVLRPALDPARPTYSSLVPFETPDRRRITLGARAEDDGARSLALLVAGFGRPWEDVGTLRLGRRLDDEQERALRYDPWRHAAALRPVGLLNRLRRSAYPASQRGRPD